MRKARALNVAIVGIACRFPGAPDVFSFWENVLAGKDAMTDVPDDRRGADVSPISLSADNDRAECRRGGYLDSPITIDPAADCGVPELALIHDAARAALADAGLADGLPDGRRIEVVIGRGNDFNRGSLTRIQYGRSMAQTIAVARALRPDLTEDDLKDLRADLESSLPQFDADRPNFREATFVDAAGASSLVALDLGARALAEGRADLAIVGGVYVQSDLDFPMEFSRPGTLSRTGRSRPFARDADGMVPGEGVGVVVLKRLGDAERDGDRVYATLKGVGLANNGLGPAMRRAYRDSGVRPASVGLIEGHGLGVPAADRAELHAIRAVFPLS